MSHTTDPAHQESLAAVTRESTLVHSLLARMSLEEKLGQLAQ